MNVANAKERVDYLDIFLTIDPELLTLGLGKQLQQAVGFEHGYDSVNLFVIPVW